MLYEVITESLGARFLYYSGGHQEAAPGDIGPENRIDALSGALAFLDGLAVPGGREAWQ